MSKNSNRLRNAQNAAAGNGDGGTEVSEFWERAARCFRLARKVAAGSNAETLDQIGRDYLKMAEGMEQGRASRRRRYKKS